MEDYLLFRKRSPLEEEGLGFLAGCEEHSFLAKRNRKGRASSSAILLRALISCLEGQVVRAWTSCESGTPQLAAEVRSVSTPGLVNTCSVRDGFSYFLPHGSSSKATYHLGVLALIQALLANESAQDLLSSYRELLKQYQKVGLSPEIKSHLLQTVDELYFWLRYRAAEPIPANDKLDLIEISDSESLQLPPEREEVDIRSLTDPIVLESLIKHTAPNQTRKVKRKNQSPEKATPGRFVGEQLSSLIQALDAGENVLLAGYTGTGKTMCVHQAATSRYANLVTVEGKEGMIDLDFLGAYLPQTDGSRRWKDGPVAHAMRLAETEPVILFLDELNRFPRTQVNILIGLMNQVQGSVCQRMGLELEENRNFYVTEIPMSSEVIFCPIPHLSFIAAGNFGRSFAVYELDPALRRRFSTVIDFDFLPAKSETALVKREHPRLGEKVIQALVNVAVETRRMLANGELPGCVDTASLLNWAGKCEREAARSVQAVMNCARKAWADQVCGRNHIGLINEGSFNALQDYLQTLGILDVPSKDVGKNEMLFPIAEDQEP